jgi:histone H3
MARTKMHARKEDDKSRSKKSLKTKAMKSKSSGKEVAIKAIPNKDAKKTTGGVKKPHRFRPGTVALRDIRRMQKSTDLCLRRIPFIRLIREVTQNTARHDMRWSPQALLAVQTAAESFLTEVFEASNALAVANGRHTPTVVDMRLAMALNPIWKLDMAPLIRHAKMTSRQLRQVHSVQEFTRSYAPVDPAVTKLMQEKAEMLRKERELKRALTKQTKAIEAPAAVPEPEPQQAPEAEPEPAAEPEVAAEPEATPPLTQVAEADAAELLLNAAKKQKKQKKKQLENGQENGHHVAPTSLSAGFVDE